jgi:3-oxoadipate enol-lactonase
VIPAHVLDGPEDAPVLVLPSSLGTTCELWAPNLEAFAREFRVLRYEHRGHGDSPAPPGPYAMEELALDALDLLDALGIERASWCGLSLGGMVGMWLGANAPARLERLVLGCTAARVPAPDAYAQRAAVVREQGIEPVADAVVAKWFALAPQETRERFRAVLVSQPSEGYAACCEALAGWDFRGELPRVSVPTLVVAGSVDEATPQADTDLLAERIPDARLVTLDGAAHLANLELPQEFADAALAHLKEAA